MRARVTSFILKGLWGSSRARAWVGFGFWRAFQISFLYCCPSSCLPFFVLPDWCFFILPVCPSSCFLFCFCFCLPVHISVDCSFTYLFEFVCSFTSFSSSSACLILNLSPNLNYNLYLNLTHVCARVLILCRPTRRFAASLIF